MFSYEIDNYLRDNRYVLSMTEYNSLIQSSPQVSHIKLEQTFDFYSRYLVETSDSYSWGIYILNYDVDNTLKSAVTY